MFLDLIIKIHKIKLDKMISKDKEYSDIVKESQKLDKYITRKTIKLMKQKEKKSQF